MTHMCYSAFRNAFNAWLFFLLNLSTEKNSFSKTIITTHEQSNMSYWTKIYRVQKDITLGFEQLEGKNPLQEKGRC